MLIPHSFAIQPGQEAKIRRALKQCKGCRIQVKKGSSTSSSGHHHQQQLLVTPAHVEKYRKASHGSIVSLPFKHEDLKKNHRGGFLPLLAAALAPVIGGVAGGLIEKGIAGSGIRDWKSKPWWLGGKISAGGNNNKQLFTVKKHGSGMILNPWHGGGSSSSSQGRGGGRGGGVYSMERHGSGMILNPWPRH